MRRDLAESAATSRITALKMVSKAGAAHIGSSLSSIDILTVLFSLSLTKPETKNVVLISKGHAAAGVYAVLNTFKVIPDSWISDYCQNGSPLGGHVTSTNVPLLELSTGSLGHALPFALGRALAKKLQGEPGQVYVLLSDGECDEGSNWEAVLLAAHLRLENLTVVIDRNRLQSLGDTELTVALEPLDEKWKSFNWNVVGVDGHNVGELQKTLSGESHRQPTIIIADTIKGKGVDFMEGNNLWHYRPPNKIELDAAIGQLE
jgi:transketolase